MRYETKTNRLDDLDEIEYETRRADGYRTKSIYSSKLSFKDSFSRLSPKHRSESTGHGSRLIQDMA